MKLVFTLLVFGKILAENAVSYDGNAKPDPQFSDEFQVGPITRLQNNCAWIRYVLSALPSYSPAKDSITNYLRKRPERNFKSFRKIVITMMKSIYYNKEEVEQAEREGNPPIKALIGQLMEAKAQYADEFLPVDEQKFQIEKDKTEKLEDEKEKVLNEVKVLKKKLADELFRRNKIISEIEAYGELFGEKGLTEDVQKFQLMEQMTNKVLVAYKDPNQIEEFKGFLNANQMTNAVKKFEEVIKLDEQLSQFKHMKELVEMYENVPEEVKQTITAADSTPTPTPFEHDATVVDADLLAKKIDALEAEIEKALKAVQADITKKSGEVKKRIQKVDGYKVYFQNVEALKASVKKLEDLKAEEAELAEHLDSLDNQIKNLEMDAHLDFTLAQNSQSKLEEKIATIKLKKEQLAESGLEEFFAKAESNFKAIHDKYMPVFANSDILDKSLEFYEHKLQKVKMINDLETEIDVRMGRIIADIQYLPGGFRCFTIPHLSYIFFVLVKINAVVKEQDFLRSFLDRAGYLRAKEFIIYNYTLFAGPDFVKQQFALDDMKVNFESEMEADRDLVKGLYIKNWCFLVSVYKEYTEFGTQTEDAQLSRVPFNFGRRILGMLGFTPFGVGGMAKGVLVIELGGIVVKELIKMIPFIGNIPFLDALLKYIFGQIAHRILNFIIKFVGNHASDIMKFWDIFKQVFDRFKSPGIINADYQYYIDKPEETSQLSEDEKAKLQIDASKIEQMYLDVVQQEKSSREFYVKKVIMFEENFKTTDRDELRTAPKKNRVPANNQSTNQSQSQNTQSSGAPELLRRQLVFV